MAYPNNNEVETYCDGEQRWRIWSPEYPGTAHCIQSQFMNDPEKGPMLPSAIVRKYMADMAKMVRDLPDWGGGGGP